MVDQMAMFYKCKKLTRFQRLIITMGIKYVTNNFKCLLHVKNIFGYSELNEIY